MGGDQMTAIASRCLAVAIVTAAIAPAIRADDPKSGTSEQNIKRWIDQLGSDRYKVREQASLQLAKLGKSAMPNLKQAMQSPDAEVRRRAQQLVEQIDPPPVPPLIPPVKIYL
jgi:hypothetical protein